MRFSFAFVVLVVTVAAVSAGVYPVKTGSAKGRTKDGSDGNTKHHPNGDDDDNRFHLQSADGQYAFGHVTGNQGRAEMRTKDGTVTGYYSYVGGNGEVVYVNYVADKDGYRVVSNKGVPSASVTIEGVVGTEKENAHHENDLQKVFSDFTKRIQEKVLARQAGQKSVDTVSDGQRQVIVEPEILYPTKETKPSKHEEKIQFPDWNQVKISTTHKPMDEIKPDEGQQEIVDPKWDDVKITTQKSDIIIGHDNDGQESVVDDWKSAITTTETATHIPLVPHQDQSQVPTNGEHSNAVFPENRNKEITTDIPNSRINTESTVIDEAQDNSPAVKPEVSITIDIQTTTSYYDEPRQSTESSIKEDDVQTTISGTKQSEESSTAVISESVTEQHQIVDEEKNKVSIETDNMLTTIKPLDETVPITEDSSDFINSQSTILPNIDFTINENESMTTLQPEGNRVEEIGTTIGVVTEKNEEHFEFRTLEPTDRIGTTMSPNYENSEGQEQEIIWPEIPQEPIPQVLVPLNPYEEYSQTKNSGIKKSHEINSRLVRQNVELDEWQPIMSSESSETETTTSTIYLNVENKTLFDFPKYFLTG